jgi:hypothetical protein
MARLERFPTIAASFAAVCAANVYAVITLHSVAPDGILACATAVGVLRFAFSESLFRQAHDGCAALNACVGFPLIGFSCLLRLGVKHAQHFTGLPVLVALFIIKTIAASVTQPDIHKFLILVSALRILVRLRLCDEFV